MSDAAVPGDNGNGANPLFAEYEPRLFDLYTLFRYNELICRQLTRRALQLERWVKSSVLFTLAISLFSPIVPGMNHTTLNWIWGSFTTAAMLLTVYSLFQGSSEGQFRWFQLATRFHASADQVELLSLQVKRGKLSEDEIVDAWEKFTVALSSLMDGAGPAFLDFEAKQRGQLTDELAATLRREGKAR